MRKAWHNSSSSRSAFTLVEILVVIAIIALLAAILFPAFARARESSRQATCATNLQQISIALQEYFQDERRYPDSLVDLLPENSKFDDGSGSNNATIAQNVTGYLKNGSDGLLCPNDDLDNTTPRSSYGSLSKVVPPLPTATPPFTDPNSDVGRYAFNYWGYNADGFAYPDSTTAGSQTPDGSPLLLTPTSPPTGQRGTPTNNTYNFRKNPIRFSLSNRFAPSSTIVTHCMFHRVQTANNLAAPGDLNNTADPSDSQNARDIVLRLDGSAKAIDVSQWKNLSDANGFGKWQSQTP